MRATEQERQILKQQKADTLRYVSDMIRQLRNMVDAERDQMLTYLLDMAYVEANDRLRGRPDADIRKTKPAARGAGKLAA